MVPDAPGTLTEPHVSVRVVRGFVAHFEATHGRAFVDDVLADAGLPRAHVEDAERWVSYAWVGAFCEAVVRRGWGEDAAPGYDHPAWQHWRSVGRATLRPEALGPVYAVMRALGAPGRVYGAVPRLSARANRTLALAARRVGPGRVVVEAAPTSPDRPLVPALCWNLRGILEAIPTLWGLPPARVSHPACSCGAAPERAAACVYEVTHDERDLPGLARMGAGVVGAGALAAGIGAAAGASPALAGLAGASLALAFSGWARRWSAERELREASERLDASVAEADRRYAELWAEQQELRRALLASRKLSGYLAGDIVDAILRDPEAEVGLGGRRTEAAVLFADIVGYTPRCEPMRPEDVVDELNLYFSHVDPVIARHGGVIDKRMGDGLMVVFVAGAHEGPDAMRGRAVRCALQLHDAVAACNRDLARRRAAPFSVRVGVAAGALVQGNMGSPVKLEYTVIGDVVNLAARLESQATPGHVLVAKAAMPGGGEGLGGDELDGGGLDGGGLDGAVVVGERVLHVKGKTVGVPVVELRPAKRAAIGAASA